MKLQRNQLRSAAIGAATGHAGATLLSTVRGKNSELPKVGATGGAVVGANIGAINGAFTGSLKYLAGNTAKFFGLTD